MLPPSVLDGVDGAAVLCDSMFVRPFLISSSELEELLVACAVESAIVHETAVQSKRGFFLMGYEVS